MATLLEVNMPDQRQLGGRVTVIGRLLQPTAQRLTQANEALAEVGAFPPVEAALFRFAMTCCAGDAQPVSIFLNLPDDAGLEHLQWVEITGELQHTDSALPVLIIAEEVHAIAKPPRPYLAVSPFR